MRVLYRIRQFFSSLGRGEPVTEADWAPYLNNGQCALFRSLPPSEQRHACRVLRLLHETGRNEPALAQAALLHDVGRALPDAYHELLPCAGLGEGRVRVRIWHRVIAVLLRAVHPDLLRRVVTGGSGNWRRPYWALWNHAALGAHLAAASNSAPLAVALIRWHHAGPQMPDVDPTICDLLSILQSADEQT